MNYIMKCGHPNSKEIDMTDGTQQPICEICGCMDIVKKIAEPTEGLEGRFAICYQHKGNNKPIPSRWDLPFFKYNAGCKYDFYYCGCYGWD